MENDRFYSFCWAKLLIDLLNTFAHKSCLACCITWLLTYSLTLYSSDLIFVSHLTAIKYHSKARAKAADLIVSTISCVDFRHYLFDWWAAWPRLSSSPSCRLFYVSFGVHLRRFCIWIWVWSCVCCTSPLFGKYWWNYSLSCMLDCLSLSLWPADDSICHSWGYVLLMADGLSFCWERRQHFPCVNEYILLDEIYIAWSSLQ